GVDRPDTIIQPAQHHFRAYEGKHAQAHEGSGLDRADALAGQMGRGMLNEADDGGMSEKQCRANQPERSRSVGSSGGYARLGVEWLGCRGYLGAIRTQANLRRMYVQERRNGYRQGQHHYSQEQVSGLPAGFHDHAG